MDKLSQEIKSLSTYVNNVLNNSKLVSQEIIEDQKLYLQYQKNALKHFYFKQNEFMKENKLNYKFSKSMTNIINQDSSVKSLDDINNLLCDEMIDSTEIGSTLKIDKDKMSNHSSASDSDFDDSSTLDVNQALNCILCNKEMNYNDYIV